MHRRDSLQNEAEFARYKNAVGRIVVTTLSLLSFYTLLLSLLPQFMVALTVNFAISPFIIAMFAAVMWPVIAYSGFPPFLFRLANRQLEERARLFGAGLARLHRGGGGLKLVLIHTTQTFASL